ncbi:MAG: hypothetical protein IPL83_07505 [Bdellovibrionales bacterium]|nr:hypothetical protein [Bdellovibrionales bacterium]
MKVEMKSGPIYFVLSIVSNISIAFGLGVLVSQHTFLIDIIKIHDHIRGAVLLILLGLAGWLAIICNGRSLIIEDGRLIVRNYFEKVIFECLLSEIDSIEFTGFPHFKIVVRNKKIKIPNDLVFKGKNELLDLTQTKRVGLSRDFFILHDYLKEVVESNAKS